MQLGVLSNPSNNDDGLLAIMIWTKTAYSRIVRVHIYCDCVVSVSKRISKKYWLDYYSDQTRANFFLQNEFFFNYRLDYWSGHSRTNRTVCYGPVYLLHTAISASCLIYLKYHCFAFRSSPCLYSIHKCWLYNSSTYLSLQLYKHLSTTRCIFHVII